MSSPPIGGAGSTDASEKAWPAFTPSRASSQPALNQLGHTRDDIDGLRAVAIIAVVAYHAFPSVLSGGYVGVDVFFVISGFLITSLLVRAHENGRFDYLEFLARRARRLFPALVLMMLVVGAVGYFGLYAEEFSSLGRGVYVGAGFLSNVAARHALDAYFAPAVERSPLIHLWSLGVEEQFYFLWPLMLWVLWRIGRLSLVTVATLSVLSLVADVAVLRHDAIGAFYLPHLRAWELLAGAALSLRPNRSREDEGQTSRWREASTIVGLALIVASATLLSAASQFPGMSAVPAVAGTMLVIGPGRGSFLNDRVLSQPAVVFIGLISYPLYLWHWPALAFVRIIGRNDTASISAALGASAVAAIATYLLIERPIRRLDARRVALPLLGALFVVGAAGYAARSSWWLPRSVKFVGADRWEYPEPDALPRTPTGLPMATLGASNPRQEILIVGDSHAEQYWPRFRALESQLRDAGIRVTFLTASGCPFVPHAGALIHREFCDEIFEKAMAIAEEPRFQRVAIAAFWEGYFNESRDTAGRLPGPGDGGAQASLVSDTLVQAHFGELARRMAALVKAGKTVVFVGSNPTGTAFDRKRVYQRFSWTATHPAAIPITEFHERNRRLSAMLRRTSEEAGARFLDPTTFLCPNGQCAVQTADSRPVYRDSNHLLPEFARRLTIADSIVWGALTQ